MAPAFAIFNSQSSIFKSTSGAYGIRTRVTDVRGQRPRPLDECASSRELRIDDRRSHRLLLSSNLDPQFSISKTQAGEQGFEPRFYGPEPYVLPLDDSPIETVTIFSVQLFGELPVANGEQRLLFPEQSWSQTNPG